MSLNIFLRNLGNGRNLAIALRNIYKIFTANDTKTAENIEIKLMQHGRMKGQAFVTFLNIDERQLHSIEKALNETNGYILKNKPMVVCFGKKQ